MKKVHYFRGGRRSVIHYRQTFRLPIKLDEYLIVIAILSFFPCCILSQRNFYFLFFFISLFTIRLENIDEPTKPLGATEVALKFLAAPINPADINIAQGNYGKQPPLPAFGGNEGVAVIQQAGAAVKNVKVGDWVVPAVAPFGTWRQFARAEGSEVLRVPNDIPVAYAATLMVNPGTAYRLLRDFASLKPGDVIIQNGANSMVGLAVIQMAREMGVKTINIIRSDR